VTVTVVGLGKIGLPLAVQYAMKGEQVFGVDINQKTVDCVNEGLEPFPEEENLKEFLTEVVNGGKLLASTSTSECVSKSDVVVVVVPLFVDASANPDFAALDSATAEIARGLKKGTLVAYETTLPIGTTRNRFMKTIEEITGYKAGEDFYVVFSPERVLTGRVFRDLKKYPKILGGVTEACAEKGYEFYNRVLEFDERSDLEKPNGVWILNNSEAAEFVKLAETTYRDVNIALANQFALYADSIDVDIYQVIQSANSQPYSRIHKPGMAVGGHCIPVYPKFYLLNDPKAKIVEAARELNESMPSRIANQIFKYFENEKKLRILILGLSYRAGVKEIYNSGCIDVAHELRKKGAVIEVHDRLFSKHEIENLGLSYFSGNSDSLDCIIIQNEDPTHETFLKNRGLTNVPIFDGRNSLKSSEFNIAYTLGKPN
jgi:nucleotide sugar dehydrogenase